MIKTVLMVLLVGLTFSEIPKEKPLKPEKRRLYGVKLVDCNPVKTNFNQGGQ